MMTIGIIGSGNMGSAIIKGILKAKLINKSNIFATDLDFLKLKKLKKETGINIADSNKKLIKSCELIIIAVKPQAIDTVLDDLKQNTTKKIVISIAAGITTKYIEEKIKNNDRREWCNQKMRVLRVMPNTPALIGEGMIAISSGRFASSNDLKLANKIFSSLGKVIRINEKLMNAVTAVSGSGPAYLFYFVEALVEGAYKLGLPKDIADILVKQTIYGASKMVVFLKDDPIVLRQQVTSPGGTTMAAIKVLESKRFKEIIKDAITSAKNRAQELTK